MDSTDVVVIGAGVIGLAIARALAEAGRETLVLERHSRPGQETTSRNSGVIHSGIYYPTDSLKAQLCVRGRDLLYAFCAERGIAHQRCGKLIVALEAQVPALAALHRKAIANGVNDLTMLDASEVRRLEPNVRCSAALLSPSTGIVDVHELLIGYLGDLEANGGVLVLRTSLEEARVVSDGFILRVHSGESESELHCRHLINCAGLSALDLLRRIRGYPQERWRRSYFAKGNYFVCQGIRPFQRLVYPMPNSAGLGIHATLDLDGTTRFGPDVQWVEQPEYDVDPGRAAVFYTAIREYWPSIPDGSLQPGYAGIRPKLVGPDSSAADFEIESEREHSVPGLVNLMGIESPGLTSALAIGERIARMIANQSA
jgi:L-2-hydroxyglutarate oxidase LhgO